MLLLPHGYDGQGPEHSNAHIERYLALSNDDYGSKSTSNWYVCNPSTTANYFHMMRWQLQDHDRKPLIVFSPKKFLKHPIA